MAQTTTDKEFKGSAVPTTITNTINSVDTAVSLAASTGWPTGAQQWGAVIDKGLANEEKVICSTRSGLNVTIVSRGADNTTASSHSAGATIEHCLFASDLDSLFRHATDTTIDDHSQYMHISTARTVTAANTYNEKQQFNMKNASTPALDLKAAASATVGVLRGYASDGTTKVFEISDAGSVKSTATSSYFGPGAFGGTGSYIDIGNQGDNNNVYAVANGSGTNVGIILQTKGSGTYAFRAGGTNLVTFDNTGIIKSAGDEHAFGVGAFGGTGTYIDLGSLGDSAAAWIDARGSVTNVGLQLRSKGSGDIATYTDGSFYVKNRANSSVTFQVTPSNGIKVGNAVVTTNSRPGVVALSDIPSALAGNPTSGGFLYVTAGVLRYRGPSGTDTLIANA